MFAEIGTTGIRRAGGIIFDHSTRDLRGGWQSARAFAEMHDFLPVVRASILIYQLLVRQSSFQLQPAKDGGTEAKAIRDFAESALDDMETDFGDVVSDALTMLVYGWALSEEVYKVRSGPKNPAPLKPSSDGFQQSLERGYVDPPASSKYSDGLVGWRKIALRAQRSIWLWEMDRHGTAIGMWQNDPSSHRGPVLIPLEKALVFRTENAGGNPEGRSMLASSWKFWTVLKRLIEREAIGLGRDLTGIPMMKVPAKLLAKGADAEEKATLARTEALVTGLTANEQAAVVISSACDVNNNPLWEFSLVGVSGPARNFQAMGETINRYEQRIATSMLTAFLLLGQGQRGTQALAENQADMLLMAANAVSDSVAAVFNRYSLPRLMRANGWPEELAPIMVPTKIKRQIPLVDLGQFLTAIAGIGAPLFGMPAPAPALAKQPAAPVDENANPDDPNAPDPAKDDPNADPNAPPADKPAPVVPAEPVEPPPLTPEQDELLQQLLARADLTLPTKEL